MAEKELSPAKACAIFLGFTLYFYILLFTLYPFLRARLDVHPIIYWFATGYCLFVPLFLLAVGAVRREGALKGAEIRRALHLRRMTRRDLIYSSAGLMLMFVLSGMIYGASLLLHKHLGMRMLTTTPWFMQMYPFRGAQRLLLLLWLPMFFFNIVGEELMWRGYIQSRLKGRWGWLICSLLWMIFHLPFGGDLMIMLIPVICVIPYVFLRTGNTATGIFIHGLYNGPIFVMVALGLVK